LSLESLEDRALMTAPAAPTFTTTAVSATQINLSWNAVAGATGYYVDVSRNGGAWQTYQVGAGTTAIGIPGLARATPNTFDVAAFNASGTTWARAPQNAVTLYNPATSAAHDPYLPAPTYSPAPAVPLFASGVPSPTDVTQGYEGDCWLLASLAEVAARAPQDIVNMFHYYGDSVENGARVQLYTVRFFNTQGAARYVTVDTELPNGGTYYDRVQNPMGTQSLWVALAEKAYAEATGLGYVASFHTGIDSYDAIYSGYAQWALQAITGKPAGYYGFNSSNLAAAWNAGDMIVLTSDSNPTNPYIVPTHAYAVVNYNGSTFEVFNPWGTDVNGTAPGRNTNGQLAYGEYWFGAGFLAQNFATEALGSGASVINSLTMGSRAAAVDSVMARPSRGSIAPDWHLGSVGETVSVATTRRVDDGCQERANAWAAEAVPGTRHLSAGLDDVFANFAL
jgi:hypothetical protein